MKIIKHGTDPQGRPYVPDEFFDRTFTCEQCRCVFQFERGDGLHTVYETRANPHTGDLVFTRDAIGVETFCPCCRAWMRLYWGRYGLTAEEVNAAEAAK